MRSGAALALLSALVLVSPGAGAAGAHGEPVEESVRAVLHDDRYRFCHEDDYPLTRDEHAWCDLVGKTSSTCPSLPKACTQPPVDIVGSLFGRRRARGTTDKGEIAPPPDEDSRQRPPKRFSLPDMSGFAKVLFFLLLAVGIAVVVRAIVKNLLREREEDAAPTPAPADDEPTPGAPAARGPIETDVERLLARARAEAARGEYARAVDDAYAALLRRLDGDGLIEIHPSRTNGDYVRSLRERPDLKGAVRGIVRDVEGVQFGATPPSEPVFRSVLERVIPLVSRALSVAIVLLGLSAALSCTPHDGREGDDEWAGTSPGGTQAIVEVMTRHGIKIRHRAESLSKLERPMVVVLRSSVRLDTDGWKHLLEWVREKGGYLILAGVGGMPDEIGEDLRYDSETSPSVTGEPDLWVGSPTLSIPPGRRLSPRAGATDEEEDVVLVRKGSIVATERRMGKGRVLAFADDYLFTNAALTLPEDAAFLLTTFYHAAVSREHEVELCDQWTGAGAQTPMESLNNAHLTPVVVQLFVLLALLFLWKGRAFARLRDPPAQTRRSFADHARALGTAYGRARATRHVAGLYAVWALERLRERVHRSGRTGLIALAEGIAARTGQPVGEVMEVLVEASGARDEAAPPSSFRPQSLRDGRTPPPRGKDAIADDLALMHKLASYLTATGQRPTQRTNTPRER